MKVYLIYAVLFYIYGKILLTSGDDYYNTYSSKFRFPEGSFIGLFFALAFPLDLPNKNVFVSYNFEGYWYFPDNQSNVQYPPLVERSDVSRSLTDGSEQDKNNQTFKNIDRRLVYAAIEAKMKSLGYAGRPCLLRAICESALIPVTEINGVLGDLIHIIFTPSSSINEGLPNIYGKAENYGKFQQDCTKYHRNCTTSFFDLITWAEHVLESEEFG